MLRPSALSGGATVAAGAPVSLAAGFVDQNLHDTHTAQWDWGDGTADTQGSVTREGRNRHAGGTHTFTPAGVFSVRVTVTDSTGGSTSVLRDITVN